MRQDQGLTCPSPLVQALLFLRRDAGTSVPHNTLHFQSLTCSLNNYLLTTYQVSVFCIEPYVSLNNKSLISLANSQRISVFLIRFMHAIEMLGFLTLPVMVSETPAAEMGILGTVSSIGDF